MNSIISRILGKKDDKARFDFLRFHYHRHFYCADKFKDIMHGLHSVAFPEVVNEHEAIIAGAYFCTRDQLLAANGERHSDWGPFPDSIRCATFVVQPDCSLRVHFEQLYPVATVAPVQREDFKKTILTPISLKVLGRDSTHTLPSLLSAARSEHLVTGGTDGPFMTKLSGLFGDVAEQAYGGHFTWSRYNRQQWDKFTASSAATDEGGSCVFSCEADGDYRIEIHDTFKGLFLGVPTGMYPYSISVRHGIAKMNTDALRAWLTMRGFANV